MLSALANWLIQLRFPVADKKVGRMGAAVISVGGKDKLFTVR